ncbi:hypothetical protein ABWK50_11775 [Priestia megaterium]|uniref:hypothetical protein n=1 Tax=Priestia megaterium TaxID=1404 RepID=UPI0033938803
MANTYKSIVNNKQKMSKEERKIRAEMEETVVNQVKTEPKPLTFIKKAEETIFNQIVKLNENFTESDSISISLLTKAIYRFGVLSDVLDDLDPLDETATQLERRIHAYERSITTHMNLLCIPLNQRLKLANDVAKLAIEEKKLANMEAPQVQEVNPLLAVLEARKHAK